MTPSIRWFLPIQSAQFLIIIGTIPLLATARQLDVMPYVPESIKRSPNESQPFSIGLANPMRNATVGINEVVTLVCDIFGSPKPDYEWLWNGMQLPKSHTRYVQKVELYGGVLTINKASLTDAGRFTCVGFNPAGRRETTAQLTVTTQPQRKRKRKKNQNRQNSRGNKDDEVDDYDVEELPPSGAGGRFQTSVIGFCQSFKSTVCKTFLDGQTVFVTSQTYQYMMEKRLTKLVEKIAEQLHESCVKLLLEAVCYFNFPVCHGDRPRHLCSADCARVTGNAECLSSLNKLRTNLAYLQDSSMSSVDEDSFDFLSLLPDCSSLPTQSESSQCIGLSGGQLPPPLQPQPQPPPPPPLLLQPTAPPLVPARPPPQPQPQPPSVQHPSTANPDCYNGTGRDYNGPSDRGALTNRPCLAWSSQAGFGHLGGSTCRNPVESVLDNGIRFNSPWCFVADGTKEACAVRRCVGGGSVRGRPGAGPGVNGVSELSPMSSREMLPVFVSLGVLAFLALGILLICCFCRRASPASSGSGYQGMIKAVGMATAQVHLHQQQQQQQQLLLRQSQRHLAMDSQQQQQQQQQAPVTGLMAATKAKELSLSQIRFGEGIGESAFGRVYKGELIGLYSATSLTPVIIKCLNANADARTQTEFQRDTQSKSELRHPNLVCLLGAALRQSPLAQVHEALSGGDLREFLIYRSPQAQPSAGAGLLTAHHHRLRNDSTGASTDGSLGQSDMLHIAAQVAAGLDYLASRGLVHRDIASRNVQMGESMLCKLGDLGAARDLYSCDYYRLQDRCALPIRWLPAEAIFYGQFSPQSDIHSFGVLLWEIWSYGLQPYYGDSNSQVIELIRQRQLLHSPPDCPLALSSLMLDCWSEAPTRRPTAAALHERLRQLLAESENLSQHHLHHHHHHHHPAAMVKVSAASQQRVIPVPVPPPPSSMLPPPPPPPPTLHPPSNHRPHSMASTTGSSDSSTEDSSESETSPNGRQAAGANRRRPVGMLAVEAGGMAAYMLPAQAV